MERQTFFIKILQDIWLEMLHQKEWRQPGKFNAKIDEGIFLGYSPDNKSYRYFNIRLSKVVTSFDVTVDDESL